MERNPFPFASALRVAGDCYFAAARTGEVPVEWPGNAELTPGMLDPASYYIVVAREDGPWVITGVARMLSGVITAAGSTSDASFVVAIRTAAGREAAFVVNEPTACWFDMFPLLPEDDPADIYVAAGDDLDPVDEYLLEWYRNSRASAEAETPDQASPSDDSAARPRFTGGDFITVVVSQESSRFADCFPSGWMPVADEAPFHIGYAVLHNGETLPI